MSDSLWTFGFEIANFVALAGVLAWLFFKPVRKALQEQQAKARSLLEEAEQTLADARRQGEDIAAQRAELATELEAMRTRARDLAEQDGQQYLADARAQLERERSSLKQAALHIEKAQMSKIARAVATVAHNTVSQFLQQMEGPELEWTLLKAACRELQVFSNNSLAPVTVESAARLADESAGFIKAALGDAAKTAVFRVAPELQGGLRISTARGLIDASIAGLADYAKQSLLTEMDSMIREDSECE